MQLETQIYKYLYDIQQASVERQFEIIGEAANKLLKIAPEYSQDIPELKSAIAFRNVLIHGYATLEPTPVTDYQKHKDSALRCEQAQT